MVAGCPDSVNDRMAKWSHNVVDLLIQDDLENIMGRLMGVISKGRLSLEEEGYLVQKVEAAELWFY